MLVLIGAKTRQPDALRQFIEYVDHFRGAPGWIGADGMPASWRHFVYGMEHINRKYAQQSLQLERATFIANAHEDDRANWLREQTIMAGWD